MLTMPRTTRIRQFSITNADLDGLLRGDGGSDLEVAETLDGTACMRIVGVRPGTLPAQLGAENGDMLESINDLPLVDVATSYAAAVAAARYERIVVKGYRNDEPFTTTLLIARVRA